MALNILLVDDSVTVRSVLSRTLKMADLDVGEILQATNGQEALDLLSRQWVDLVLADINMPVMNGIEMIERMAEDRTLDSIPVIVVSTEGSATRIEHLRSRGVRAWVRKPVSAEAIRDIVTEVLGLAGSVRPQVPEIGGVLVGRVAAEVLSRLAYLSARPVAASALPAQPEAMWCASISFSGPLTGSMRIAASHALCGTLAANIRGDGSDGDQGREDALRELLSVLCGHVLTTMAGVQAVFDMTLPVSGAAGDEQWPAMLEDPDVVALLAEEHPLLVRFTLAGPVA